MKSMLRLIAIALMICLTAEASASRIFAQEGSSPSLKIESINLDDLPEVSVLIQGDGLTDALEQIPISLREDGVEQDIMATVPVNRSAYVALVVDPLLDLSVVGLSGDEIQFEIANGASSLIQSGILTVQNDWLAAFALSEETGEFEQVTEWQRDHQAVVNALYQYEAGASENADGIADTLEKVISSLMDEQIPDEAERTLVLFTDGSSTIGNTEVNATILQAQENDVSIQLALVGEGNALTRRTLMGLATAADGSFITYENASSLQPIWSALNEDSQLLNLTYRLGSAAPNQIAIALSPRGAESIIATEDFPTLSLEPALVTVLSPEDGFTIQLDSSEENGADGQSSTTLPVELEFEWPDGVERSIASIEYTLGNQTFTQEESPFGSYEIENISGISGDSSLTIELTDEFGLSSASGPVNIIVEDSIDLMAETSEAAAASVSEETATSSTNQNPNASDLASQSEEVQVDASNQGMNILGLQLPETIEIFGVTFLVNGITLLIALFPIIFLLALFLYWLTQRNEQSAEPDYGYYEYDNNGYFYRFEPSTDDMQLTQPQVSVIEPEEELTMPVKLPSFYTNAAAYLVYVSGGEHLPKKMALETSEPVRIGRKKSFCDQILDDQRVSRLHSVITYEGGDFYIKDEGSSGGTFVNRRKLGPTDKHVLNHNDIVNFNEVEYRLEIPEPDSNTEDTNGIATAEPSGDVESMAS